MNRRRILVGLAAGSAAAAEASAQIPVPTAPRASAPADRTQVEADNRARITEMLQAWKAGDGSRLQPLLSEAVEWTITGSCLVSGTYRGREALNARVLGPFGARFALGERFRPVRIHGVFADGETVIARFDGAGTANDGAPYRNSYAWFLTFEEGLIVSVVAFFDSVAFDALWRRVRPDV